MQGNLPKTYFPASWLSDQSAECEAMWSEMLLSTYAGIPQMSEVSILVDLDLGLEPDLHLNLDLDRPGSETGSGRGSEPESGCGPGSGREIAPASRPESALRFGPEPGDLALNLNLNLGLDLDRNCNRINSFHNRYHSEQNTYDPSMRPQTGVF